jgi:TPR repeat protein
MEWKGILRRRFVLFDSQTEQGHTRAQALLGQMYEFGQDVPLDRKEAVAWYR